MTNNNEEIQEHIQSWNEAEEAQALELIQCQDLSASFRKQSARNLILGICDDLLQALAAEDDVTEINIDAAMDKLEALIKSNTSASEEQIEVTKACFGIAVWRALSIRAEAAHLPTDEEDWGYE